MITAPTPVVIPAVSSVYCGIMQADRINISVNDSNQVVTANVVFSYFAEGTSPVVYARNSTGQKITANLSIPNVAAQAAKRAAAGDTLLATAIAALEAALQDEFTLQQAEQASVTSAQAAVTSAQAAVTAAQTQLRTDQAANPQVPATIGADTTAIGTAQANLVSAQSALIAAQTAAVPAGATQGRFGTDASRIHK